MLFEKKKKKKIETKVNIDSEGHKKNASKSWDAFVTFSIGGTVISFLLNYIVYAKRGKVQTVVENYGRGNGGLGRA